MGFAITANRESVLFVKWRIKYRVHSVRFWLKLGMDFLDPVKRSALMATIRSRGNKQTELVLARLFRTNGITGWRRHQLIRQRTVDEGIRRRTVKPDFVFFRKRIAIFVDGCFWHGCRWHFRLPTSNAEFWRQKIDNNRRRDRATNAWLRKEGWTVIRIWAHALRNYERVVACLHSALSIDSSMADGNDSISRAG